MPGAFEYRGARRLYVEDGKAYTSEYKRQELDYVTLEPVGEEHEPAQILSELPEPGSSGDKYIGKKKDGNEVVIGNREQMKNILLRHHLKDLLSKYKVTIVKGKTKEKVVDEILNILGY